MVEIRAVNLNFGYVESAHAATITLINQQHHFSSYSHALSHLATSFMNQYLDERSIVSKACCRKNKGKGAFCADCGSSLQKETSPLDPGPWGESKFSEWLNQWWYANTNDMEFEDWLFDGWWPFVSIREVMKLKPEEILVVSEQAEKVLPVWVDPETFPGLSDDIQKNRDSYIEFLDNSRSGRDVKSWEDVTKLVDGNKNIDYYL